MQCFCSVKPKEWSKCLHWAQYWHNTNWHSTMRFSPYEVVYGRPPPSLLRYVPKTARVQSLEDTLYDRDQVLKLLKNHYVKSQAKMKQYADKRRTEREFEVGEFVLLMLQPYRQKSIRESTPMKLSAKYFGPYKVIERIGMVAYRLELPLTSKIHNVFHVSLLKKFYGSKNPYNEEIPYSARENSRAENDQKEQSGGDTRLLLIYVYQDLYSIFISVVLRYVSI